MKSFLEQISRTEERFGKRTKERANTKELLKESPLKADEPERIEKRLSRLARPPLSDMMAVTVDTKRDISTVSSFEPKALERILGNSDLVGIGYVEQALKVSRSIGRIIIRNGSGRVIGYGTGFMVSPRLLLTNNHVLESTADATNSLVQFNYQLDWLGQDQTTFKFALDPQKFFLTDEDLDYSLVAVKEVSLDGDATLQQFSWCFLSEGEGKVIKGESLNIIQHPNGEPKQVAFRENKLIDRLEKYLHYETDTAPGSSGSAVFNDQWEVVALHHSGVPARDGNGQILAIDGSVWREAMGEHRIKWVANEGVRVSRLVKHIKEQPLSSTEAERLRREWLEAAPNFPSESSSSSNNTRKEKPFTLGFQSTAKSTSKDTENTGGEQIHNQIEIQQNKNTKITWRIPLEVSVDFGSPEIMTKAVGQIPSSGIKFSSPNKITQKDVMPDPINAGFLQSAIARLEDSRAGEYYNEAKDGANRDEYYKDINDGVSHEDFYMQLSELIRRTHRTELKYKPATHLYPDVDLQPDGMIHSIYSGIEYDPEELIREDFQIDQERAVRLREIALKETGWGAERFGQELDLLEATLPYNCEHVVPQSWFGKREPMRGDLHHLFACETNCNSFRSNIPYFDFADFGETVRSDCGKRDSNRFEPSTGKGAVARAVLYFLLRYPGEINRTSNEYTEDRLEILLEWHREFDPSEYELHRNAVIFDKQGNRNPLIDFPEWCGNVDFRLGLG